MAEAFPISLCPMRTVGADARAEEEAVSGGLKVTAYGCLPALLHQSQSQDPKASKGPHCHGIPVRDPPTPAPPSINAVIHVQCLQVGLT